MSKHTVNILWGSEKTDASSYEFNSEAEKAAFIYGVSKGKGWFNFEVVEDVSVGKLINTLKEHKELIMEAFNPIGSVYDEMNAQFDLMISEAMKVLSEDNKNKNDNQD